MKCQQGCYHGGLCQLFSLTFPEVITYIIAVKKVKVVWILKGMTMKNVKVICVLFSILLAALLLFFHQGCRFQEEPLDKNREPETFLTFAPPETLNTDYKVHLYWHGEDKDGIVTKYIFYMSDTLRTLSPEKDRNSEMLDWNPANRKADYLSGHFTTNTDTVIMFTGYDLEKKIRRNRQAFHIAAIDDAGLIDQTPARIQFFATVTSVPTINYWVKIGDKPYKSYNPSILDTISLFTPLRIKFQGATEVVGGAITGYQWSVKGVTYPRGGEWYIPAISEIVEFPSEINKYFYTKEVAGILVSDSASVLNTRKNPLDDGDFYFGGVARDQAGAQSEVNVNSGDGLCHIVLNFDPDTEILYGDSYFTNEYGNSDSFIVDFSDAFPDTLPLNSVLRINYTGWDDKRDLLEFTNPPLPIRFKYRLVFKGVSEINNMTAVFGTPFLPMMIQAENNNPGEVDSVSMSIGSFEYTFLVRSYDEQYRYDHTPDEVTFYGNFKPTVETFEVGVMEYDFFSGGNVFHPLGDTLKFADPTDLSNRGVYPYLVLVNGDEIRPCAITEGAATVGLFYPIALKATGHDDRRDPIGSAIKAWFYWMDSDYNFGSEMKLIYPDANDLLLQEIRINIPFDQGIADPTRLGELPSGVQPCYIAGFDLGADYPFNQKIRMSPGGGIYSSESNISNYSRGDTLGGQFFIKQMW